MIRKITDNAPTASKQGGYNDKSNVAREYFYDNNGSMTKDLDREVIVKYNLLNLPKRVTTSGSDSLLNYKTYNYDATGQKLQVKSFANGSTTLTEDYIGNKIYENSSLSKILIPGGYVSIAGGVPTIHYYQTDHLGNIRQVLSSDGVLQEQNDYYAFGMRQQRGDYPLLASNKYKYNGKELETFNNFETLDYGARMYDPTIGRWNVVDPLAEKYPNNGPYVYTSNNPVRYIDTDGRSYSEFDENGNYLRTIKDNWWHNFWHGRTGRIIDGDGNITQSFKFADPKNDVNDLKGGKINKVQFVQESEVISMLSKGGVFTKENKTYNNDLSDRYSYIKEEGLGGGKLDFSLTGIPYQYEDVSQSLFLVDGVAHNYFNFGNFLFGAAGKALGLSLFELQIGAHYNSLSNPDKNGYKRQLDSIDDQFSIRMGVKHANKNNYKKMFYQVIIGPLSK